MTSIRVLRPGDEAALEAFLLPLTDSSMFLRANHRIGGLEDRGEFGQGTYVAAFEGEAIAGVIASFWQGNLSLQAPRHLAELLRELPRLCPRPIAGLVGPWEQVEQARALLGMEQAPAKMESREALFTLELQQLRVPEALAGGDVRCRLAGSGDLPALAQLRYDFLVESIGDAPGPETMKYACEAVAKNAEHDVLFLLERGGEIVATSNFNARLPDTVQIGAVFTPPALRGRGYARAVVAGSLLHARAQGASRSVLFTEEEGPARRAYEAIGYRKVGQFGLVLFR
ncbi:MAG TPA: GNAT family N-acetyltransferase [Myxococcales bacterium]|nr:GNAT family N-acetyltransferase [Myxococcales bacterium]